MTIRFGLLLLFFTCTSLSSSDCSHYNYAKSLAALKAALYYQDKWEFFSDDATARSGESGSISEDIFSSKADFKRNTRIEPIAVMRIDTSRLRSFQFGQDLRQLYVVDDYPIYVGLLYKGNKIIHMLIVQLNNSGTHPKAKDFTVGAEGEFTRGLATGYEKSKACFFFDRTFGSYSYFQGDSLYVWSRSKERFVSFKEAVGEWDSLEEFKIHKLGLN